ncbi:MAG TPA: acyltransferase [Candidatus Acidoferrales bacterium]|jgi:peptidoglycan/LPS O-acetylase OafA/YrhL|nr:acyltransferase [Candidatus Acidoferrales bacterium]
MHSSQSLKSWETKASTGNHFDVFDGLRGVAILLVVISHTFFEDPARPPHGFLTHHLWQMASVGWIGVPIFFVMSGFLISHPFFQERALGESWYVPGYALRRIAKIIPPFYLSIIIFNNYYWFRFQEPAYLKASLLWATGLANYFYLPADYNLSYWSLPVEAQFYLLLPLLFFMTRRLNLRQTAIIVLLLTLLIPLAARCFIWPVGVYTAPSWPDPLFTEIGFRLHQFPCNLEYFGYGMFFAAIYVAAGKHLVKAQMAPLSLFGLLGMALLLAYIVLGGAWSEDFHLWQHPTRWSIEISHLLAGLSAFLLLFLLFDPGCFLSRLISHKWLKLLGIVSFEWFLFHWPIVMLFREKFPAPDGAVFPYLFKTLAPLILTLIFSILVYRWFSLPILNRVRDRLKKT